MKKQFKGMIFKMLSGGILARSAGSLIGNSVHSFVLSDSIAVPPNCDELVKSSILFGIYEHDERTLISRYLPKNLDCIELGASIGYISRHILNQLEPGCRLVAVEAATRQFELLKTNTRRFIESGRLTVFHKAISYGPEEEIEFHSCENHLLSSLAKDPNEMDSIEMVAALKLDAIEESRKKHSLVVDIEGAEYDMIRNADFTHTRCIIIELHGSDRQMAAIKSDIESHGFTCIDKKNACYVFSK
jgi:FkbM family methyltransferase